MDVVTKLEKVARRKLSLLELATDMQNVSKACRLMGYSRQQFYEIRRTYQVHGAAGLADRVPEARGLHPNRVTDEVEKAVLDHCLAAPTQGCLRVAQELVLKGVQISPTGVRGVWSRHGLLSRHERLHRTLLDEHFRVAGRTKWYETIEEMQKDLDAYLAQYNTRRPHQGRMMGGRPPAEMFLKGLPKVKKQAEEKLAEAA